MKILRIGIFAVIALVLLLWFAIQTELVQNWVIGKVTGHLSRELKTEVSIKHVSFSLFNRMNMEQTLVRDQQKDTLLYAGQLKLRITDWFFLKDRIELKYIGLEDAVIKQQRSDSVWNYQFLADYFSSPAPKDTSKKPIEVQFKKIDLKNVSVLINDMWVGTRQTIKIGSMLADARNIDLVNNDIHISEVLLDKFQFLTEDFDGRRPPRIRKPHDPREMYFNAGGLKLVVDALNIENSTFFTTNLTDGKMNFIERQPAVGFDGRYIWFSKINARVKNFSLNQDTIRASIDLSTVERSGFTVKQLRANFRLTPQIMEFSNLLLKTPRSELQNYYAMKFDDFNRDMNRYIDSVSMSASFRSSSVHTDDIAYFAPELKSWKKQFQVHGRFEGIIPDFYLDNIFLKTGASYVTGDVRIKGLPDIDKTVFDLKKGTLQTNYNEVASVVPAMRGLNTPDLPALGVVRYKGSFNGTIYDFTANGNVSTNLGSFSANAKMRFPTGGDPVYSGYVASNQFNLGRFMKEKLLGTITFQGNVQGVGFAKSRMVTTLSGHVAQLQFNDYDYKNIDINGTFQKQYFIGELKANDDNFNITSQLEIDLKNEIPHFNILGDLVKSDLQKLNFTRQKVSLAGLFDLNFSGRDIDEFIGTAKILNAILVHDTTRLSFDSLSLAASFNNGRKKLTASSNEFDIEVDGKFRIMELHTTAQSLLSKYYPAYINPPKKTTPDQEFNFLVRTRDFTTYAQLIDKRIGGFNYATVSGNINSNSNLFTLNASVPFVNFEKYTLQNADIKASGDIQKLDVTGNIGKISVTDSLSFPNTQFTVRTSNDHSSVHITTRANNTLNEADLNAEVITFDDGVTVRIKPSSFVLNDKTWNLQEHGEVTIRKSFLSASGVRFTSGFQEIAVETQQEEGSNRNDLILRLKDVNIGDFLPYVLKKPKLEGAATGVVQMRDFFGKFSVDADFTTRQFRLDDDSIGVVRITGSYPTENSKVSFRVESPNDLYQFNAEGTYDIKAKPEEALDTRVRLDDASVKFLNQFLSGVFTDIRGQAEGTLQVKGDASSPTILGKAKLRNAAMKIAYTQVYYFIDEAEFSFEEDGIDVGTIIVRDRNGNKGTVRGKLYQRGFKQVRYDFDIFSNKILALDTKERDNPRFYGKAIGRVEMTLLGSEDNLEMAITAEVNDTTHITIPPINSRESGEADFIVFKEHGTAITAAAAARSRMLINLDIIANRQAQVDVVLDDLSGDVIKAVGNGRIRMRIDDGDVTMNGRYNIERGEYAFNFQSFIHKPFTLLGGPDNYIEWRGDPNNAIINIQAQYVAERVSLSELINNQSFDLGGNIRAYRGEVYVIARLSGALSSPDIDFKIDFPSSQAFTQNESFARFLNKLESDTGEMVKQVTWLIAFNSFAPYGEIRTGVDVRSIGINSISRKIGDELSKAVTKWLSSLGLQFEIGGSAYSSATFLSNNASGNNPLDRTRLNIRFTKNILNGKIIITAGTDVDVQVGNTLAAQTGNWQWLPDLSAQFVLSEGSKGKLKAIIFTRTSLDINQTAAIGRRNRMGASLSYSRDFGKKKREEKPQPKQKNEPLSPITEPDTNNRRSQRK